MLSFILVWHSVPLACPQFILTLFQIPLGPAFFNHSRRLQTSLKVFQNDFCLFHLCVLSQIKYLAELEYKLERTSSLDGNRRCSEESY